MGTPSVSVLSSACSLWHPHEAEHPQPVTEQSGCDFWFPCCVSPGQDYLSRQLQFRADN